MKKNYILTGFILFLIVLVFMSGLYMFDLKEKYETLKENNYNEAFFSLVNYINNIEDYLAKLQISKSSNVASNNLVRIWREADLASVYLSKIPNTDGEIQNICKFLNQVSDYSYSLSRETIDGKDLSKEDLERIKNIHIMSKDIENTINQMSEDFASGNLSWDDLSKEVTAYAQNVDNFNVFTNLDDNLKEYEGLIYDGAYSDHVTKENKLGLTGEDVDEETAKSKIRGFFKDKNIEKIEYKSLVEENVDIPYYSFDVKFYDDQRDINILISKKGAHVIAFNSNLPAKEQKIDFKKAKSIGKTFLDTHGFQNMEETYFINQNNILTINYAYNENGVICYPDLIKVKVSLENGAVLGMETLGYLNSHTTRNLSTNKISIEEARALINSDIEITSQREAIIPTEWKTEKHVYEFKGKIDELDFLVYVNVESGKEEDILMILETEGGYLTI